MEENHYEHLHYNKNFLTEVLARMDFLGKIEELRESFPRQLGNIISETFPILEPQKVVAQELMVSPEGGQKADGPITSNQWKFYGASREKYLTLSADVILTSHSAYGSFEDFLSGILPALDFLAKQYPDLQVRRVGLRYINNLRPKGRGPFAWNKYVNKNMLSILKILEPQKAIARAFHNLEMNQGDFRLRFQYGIHNPDYPAPVRQRVFVMDLDAFSETPSSISDVSGELAKYHDAIQSAFESSITDALRSEMNE
jgi:uncharacterized protein (TIGR04255 family)